MLLRMLYDDKLAQAAWLIGCQKTGEAILIDPERDVDRYLNAAQAEGLRITAITETHIHADFLSGSRELAERCGARLYLSDAGDADWKYRWLDQKRGGGQYDHRLVRDGDNFSIGNIDFRVLHTPGHTPEHICLLVTDRGGGASEPIGIATGDFVFVGDVGRPDLLETAAGFKNVKEQCARALAASARRFHELPDFLQVWPAHGAGSACGKALGAVPQSTVGYERRFNPALKLAGNEAEFVRYVLEGQPEPPLYFGRMKVENRDGPAVLGELPQPRALRAEELEALDGTKVAILDTRPWAEFKSGHLRGALFAPLTAAFTEVSGSYVKPDEVIYLIIDPARVTDAVRCCVRIGLDRVAGFATPQELARVKRERMEASAEMDVSVLARRLKDGDAFVLDARRASEHVAGRIAGTVNIAHTRLLDRLAEIPRDRSVIVHCRSGVRSAYATALLQRHGYTVTNVIGGYLAWVASGGGVQTECCADGGCCAGGSCGGG